MSVITTHMICPVNPDFDLIGKLKEKNILIEKTIYRYDRNDEIIGKDLLIIDYMACDATQAKTELLSLKKEKRIVESFSNDLEADIKKYESLGCTYDKKLSKKVGHACFRQEWDEKVLNGLLTMPVSIKDAKNGFPESTVYWFLNYRCDEKPAFYISKAFPEEEFRYMEEIENDIVCDLTIKGGEIIVNHLEEAQEERE